MNHRYWAGVIQLDTNESYNENLNMACELIAEGASRGAKILTLPENWTYPEIQPMLVTFAKERGYR